MMPIFEMRKWGLRGGHEFPVALILGGAQPGVCYLLLQAHLGTISEFAGPVGLAPLMVPG